MRSVLLCRRSSGPALWVMLISERRVACTGPGYNCILSSRTGHGVCLSAPILQALGFRNTLMELFSIVKTWQAMQAQLTRCLWHGAAQYYLRSWDGLRRRVQSAAAVQLSLVQPCAQHAVAKNPRLHCCVYSCSEGNGQLTHTTGQVCIGGRGTAVVLAACDGAAALEAQGNSCGPAVSSNGLQSAGFCQRAGRFSNWGNLASSP